jgi:hypothetical protein
VRPRAPSCVLLLGCACASSPRGLASAGDVADDRPACVGDIVLRWDAIELAPGIAEIRRRDGETFEYRGQAVAAALVLAVHEPLVGALPAGARCSDATRPLAIDVRAEAWRDAAIAASSRVDAGAADTSTTARLGDALFALMIELVQIDHADESVADVEPPSAAAPTAPSFAELVRSTPLMVWRWDGGTPLEIAAQRTTTPQTFAHVAELASALRQPLPGFDFESVEITCDPSQHTDCAELDVWAEGHWRDVRVVLPMSIVGGRARFADAHAAGELLGSPLVATLLDIRGPRYDEPVCLGGELYSDDFDVFLVDGSDAIELRWSTADADDVTLALDRLQRWDTIVALSRTDESPPRGPKWRRIAWLDRDGRWIARERAPR